MKTNLFILQLLGGIIPFLCHAQTPMIEWQQNFGGSQFDGIQTIHPKTNGGYIAIGHALSKDGDVTQPISTNLESDIWILNLNASGDIIWNKSVGSVYDELGTGIVEMTNGEFLAFGTSIDNGVYNHHGATDIRLIRLDAMGNVIWQNHLGGSSAESPIDIQKTADGGCIILASTQSNDGDVTVNQGGEDIWVVKLDVNGAIVWQKCFGTALDERPSRIVETLDFGYVITGGSINSSNSDLYILKIDGQGNTVWEKQYGGTGWDFAVSAKQTQDGGFIVAGSTYSQDGDVTVAYGDADFWVLKLDGSGDLVWEKSLGGSTQDLPSDILALSSGGFVVMGRTDSEDNHITQSLGLSDIWLVGLSNTGEILWDKSLGGSDNDFCGNIEETSDGGLILASMTYSHDTYLTANYGKSDGWVVKIGTISSVENLDTPLIVNAFPNPTSHTIEIRLPQAEQHTLQLFDKSGKLILTHKGETSISEIDLSPFPPDMYFLHIKTQKGLHLTQKIGKL